MKNPALLLLALALTCGGTLAQAQTAPMAKTDKMAKKNLDKMGHGKMEHDHMMMHDGKMMVMKGGMASPMTETMTLPNGTQVMVDGSVMMKDGKKMMLKEGQEIGSDGKMHDDKMEHKMLHKGEMHDGKTKMKGKM